MAEWVTGSLVLLTIQLFLHLHLIKYNMIGTLYFLKSTPISHFFRKCPDIMHFVFKTKQLSGARSTFHLCQNSPAAKCRGDDFLPAVSLALTLCVLTNFLTLLRSPFRQASNNSLPASFEPDERSQCIPVRRVVAILNLRNVNCDE